MCGTAPECVSLDGYANMTSNLCSMANYSYRFKAFISGMLL
jgi:hypothetical protein